MNAERFPGVNPDRLVTNLILDLGLSLDSATMPAMGEKSIMKPTSLGSGRTVSERGQSSGTVTENSVQAMHIDAEQFLHHF